MFITIGMYTPLYSISLFLPTIVKTFTASPETTQLLTVPPYVVACIFCIGAGYFADRQGTRGIYMIVFSFVAYVQPPFHPVPSRLAGQSIPDH